MLLRRFPDAAFWYFICLVHTSDKRLMIVLAALQSIFSAIMISQRTKQLVDLIRWAEVSFMKKSLS